MTKGETRVSTCWLTPPMTPNIGVRSGSGQKSPAALFWAATTCTVKGNRVTDAHISCYVTTWVPKF